jgi:3-oxoacyl-[acyl-carrier protein] reductase
MRRNSGILNGAWIAKREDDQMDLGLKGRIALVAGASSGLGYASAMELASEGANVTITARRANPLQAAAANIKEATGAEVLAVPGDVTIEADVRRMIDETVKAFGRLDILIPNSGGPPAGFFTDFSDHDYRQAVELTLISTISMCRHAVPHMRRQKWGRIVAITSIAAKEPVENLILSNTARAGTLGFLKSLSQQVAEDGITVNALCPGYHLTERLRSLASLKAKEDGIAIEDVQRKMAAAVAMKRLGEPREFAALAAFLASERATYITGTVTQIDGGLYKGLF